jgi:uncharacterized membrane protein YgcG
MTHHPFDPDELDQPTGGLASVARELETLAASETSLPPADLTARIQARIDEEPLPGGWLGLGGLFRNRAWASAFVAAAATVVVIVGAVTFGQLVGLIRDADLGSTPGPSIIVPSVPPSPTSSPTPSPTLSPSASPSPSAPSPSPSGTDDELETPEPTESEDDDNSGPGGGGDDDGGDSSGPGSGDDDNSGPGGG